MCSYARMDKIRNECIREKMGVVSNDEKMRESQLRQFGHIRRILVDALVKRCENREINQLGGKWGPKKT